MPWQCQLDLQLWVGFSGSTKVRALLGEAKSYRKVRPQHAAGRQKRTKGTGEAVHPVLSFSASSLLQLKPSHIHRAAGQDQRTVFSLFSNTSLTSS